jgi:hypothetical protein
MLRQVRLQSNPSSSRPRTQSLPMHLLHQREQTWIPARPEILNHVVNELVRPIDSLDFTCCPIDTFIFRR